MQRVTKSQRKKQRTDTGYDGNPAACNICKHYKPSIHLEGTRYQMMCGLHDFGVNPYGVCDYWEGRNGAKLEAR